MKAARFKIVIDIVVGMMLFAGGFAVGAMTQASYSSTQRNCALLEANTAIIPCDASPEAMCLEIVFVVNWQNVDHGMFRARVIDRLDDEIAVRATVSEGVYVGEDRTRYRAIAKIANMIDYDRARYVLAAFDQHDRAVQLFHVDHEG